MHATDLQPSLTTAWYEAKAADPTARARDIADSLGVSEGELAEARIGDGVNRLALRGVDFGSLVADLGGVGPVMTLTRNDTAVHETTGEVGAFASHGNIGQVTGAIDLRLFFSNWYVGYAISEETRSGLRHSVQVFDPTGIAILKVYATAKTDHAAWQRLIEAHTDQGTSITAFAPRLPKSADPDDDEIDRETLRQRWLELEHSHEFHTLLRELNVGREQALRLAGDDLARPFDAQALEPLLLAAAADGIPIMCFVGNPGCIQIFSGTIEKIVPMGPWLNVLDPDFNLHLRTDRVASAWAVIKPTKLRGRISSIELFDVHSTLICQFFGVRPPGEGERPEWREIWWTVSGS